MEYKQCLVQLDEVLNHLNEKELEKIPYEIRESIKQNKDTEYAWNYDSSKSLNEQELDRKVIAMLSYLNMEYLLNEEQKKLMEDMHKFNEKKIQEELSYGNDMEDIFKKKTVNNEIENKTLPIEIKQEKWYTKIGLYFKNIVSKIKCRK